MIYPRIYLISHWLLRNELKIDSVWIQIIGVFLKNEVLAYYATLFGEVDLKIFSSLAVFLRWRYSILVIHHHSPQVYQNTNWQKTDSQICPYSLLLSVKLILLTFRISIYMKTKVQSNDRRSSVFYRSNIYIKQLK